MCTDTAALITAASSRSRWPTTTWRSPQSRRQGSKRTTTPAIPSASPAQRLRVIRSPRNTAAIGTAHSGVVQVRTDDLPGGTICRAVKTRMFTADIPKRAREATIGQSLRGGSRRRPRATAMQANTNRELPTRNAPIHTGLMCRTPADITGQLTPKETTTTARRPYITRRDKELSAGRRAVAAGLGEDSGAVTGSEDLWAPRSGRPGEGSLQGADDGEVSPDAARRGQSREPGPAQEACPQVLHVHFDLRVGVGRCHLGAVGRQIEPPRRRGCVRRIVEPDHRRHRGRVRTALQCPSNVEDLDPQAVVDGGAGTPRCRQEAEEGIVDAAVVGAYPSRQVVVEHQRPQSCPRLGGAPEQFVDENGSLSVALSPLLLESVLGEAGHDSVLLGDRISEGGRPFPGGLGVVEAAELPPRRRPSEETRPQAALPVVERREEVHRLLPRDEAGRRRPGSEPVEIDVIAVDLHVEAHGGNPVAEPAVDAGLRSPQPGDGLTPLPDVLEVALDHLAEDSPPAVGGEDRHHGGSPTRHGPTRHRHLERVGAQRSDDAVAVVGRPCPVPLEVLGEPLPVFVAGVEAEGLSHRGEVLGGPVVADGPNGDAHQASPAASVVSGVSSAGSVVLGAARPAAERAFSMAVSRSETAWSKAFTASRRRVPSSSDWRPSSASPAAAAAVVTAVRIVS